MREPGPRRLVAGAAARIREGRYIMSHRSISNAWALVSAGALLAVLFACSSDSDQPDPLPPVGAGAAPPFVPAPDPDETTGGAGTGGASAAGAGGTQNASEENPDPIGGLAGAAGQNGGTNGGAGGAPAAGAGGQAAGGTENVPDDCDPTVIPEASPLVGWASVAGGGVNTTTGGGNLAPVVVTTLADLQLAVLGTNALVIRVQGELAPGDIAVGSNKTIIGTCGARIQGHIEMTGSVNVIFRNIEIVGYSPGDCSLDPGFDAAEGCSSGDDAITVQRNSHHVWFDHVAVRDGSDGNLDVTNGANFVTISWTKFSYTPRTDDVGSDATGAAGHKYSNLVGGTDSPSDFDDANTLKVTWHHNWWADNVVERQPRIRFGQNHLFNNYWSSDVANYCVRSGIQAQILLEGNFFDGVETPHEFNNAADQMTSNITAGATNTYQAITGEMVVGGGGPAFTDPPYEYTLDPTAGIPAAVSSGAGPQ
jgi:pectate lyase